MSLRIRDYLESRGTMYRRTDESSAVASRAASSSAEVHEEGQRTDQPCGCDDHPWALCTEHAALIIELL